MRLHGETTRSLGTAVGATSGAVTGWTSGAKPRPDKAKLIAGYFGVPVDVLLDDAKDLPPAEGSQVEESPSEFLAATPLRTAAKLALREHGQTPAGQTAFERHAAELHAMRAKAEREAGGDLREAMRRFVDMSAAYLAALERSDLDRSNAAAREHAQKLHAAAKKAMEGSEDARGTGTG